MRRIRRSSLEPRVEIMPLIDVIFLLLTFFIYAMVLMVRVEILETNLQTFGNAEPAEARQAISIIVGLDGVIRVDTEPVEIPDLRRRLDDRLETKPEAVIYLGLEDGDGTTDRGPILTAIWDELANAGLEINFVGSP